MKIYVLILLSLLVTVTGCDAIQNDSYNQDKILSNTTILYMHVISPIAQCKWLYVNSTTEGNGAWLPDPVCSPGHAFPLDTIQINGEYAKLPGKAIVGDICVSGYTSNVRRVTSKTAQQVYNNYGVNSRVTGEYEMDHIIPLELGGDNEIANLYPQPQLPLPGFKQKDKVENCFHRMVCNNELDIQKAQLIMSTDWTQGIEICSY